MKRGRVYFRLFLSLAIVISVLVVIVNIAVYTYYLGLFKSISASASNSGVISFFVEGDGIPPSVSIVEPQNTTYSSHVTELDYTVSDTSNLASCWYSLNGGVTNNTITCGNNVTGITSDEGSNTWSVSANDSSGNSNSTSVTFVVSIAAGAQASSGGGGGGAPIVSLKDFDVSPTEINIFAVAGEQISREIKLINTGKAGITINVSLSGINDIAELDSNSIFLGSGEEKTLLLKIRAPKEGISAGRVLFSAGAIKKEVFVLVNSRSEKKLFDVSLTTPESEKTIYIGEDLSTFVSLTQVGPSGKIDVSVNYVLKDFDGKILFTESESFSVYETKGYIKKFSTSGLPAGDYILGIELTYPGGFATSSVHFRVMGRIVRYEVVIISVFAVMSAIIILYSILMYIKAGRRNKNRVDEEYKAK